MPNTANWLLPYAASTDPSNPTLWGQTADLAARLEALLSGNSLPAATVLTPAAGFVHGAAQAQYRRVLGQVQLSGSLVMSSPAILNDQVILTLSGASALFGDALVGGGAVLLGATRSPNIVLRVFGSELRATTTAAANEIFLTGVCYRNS